MADSQSTSVACITSGDSFGYVLDYGVSRSSTDKHAVATSADSTKSSSQSVILCTRTGFTNKVNLACLLLAVLFSYKLCREQGKKILRFEFSSLLHRDVR